MPHRKKQYKLDQGFTIIEVMIVLAIAGLIMLIVFLAVPALQRNSRQNSQRADIGRILAGINEYRTLNNGDMPPAPQADFGSGNLAVVGGPSGVCATGLYCVTVNLGYFDAASVSIVSSPPVSGLGENTAVLVSGYDCNGNTPFSVGGQRMAAVYWLENGTQQCKAT